MWRYTISFLVLLIGSTRADFYERNNLPEGVQAKQSVPEQTYEIKLGQTLVVTTLDNYPTYVAAIRLYPEIAKYIPAGETINLNIRSKYTRHESSGYKYFITVNDNLPKKGFVKQSKQVTLHNGKVKTKYVKTPIFDIADKKKINKIFKTYQWENIESTILDPDQTFKIRVISDGFATAYRYQATFIYAETYDVYILTTENGVTSFEKQNNTLLNDYETECKSDYEQQADGTCKKYACVCQHGTSVGDSNCSKEDPGSNSCRINTCEDGYYFVPISKKSKKGRCDPVPVCTETQHLIPQNVKRGQYEQKCQDNVCRCEFHISGWDGSLQVGQVTDTCLKHNSNHCVACGNGFDATASTSNTLELKSTFKGESQCLGKVCYCQGGETVEDSVCENYPSIDFTKPSNSHPRDGQKALQACTACGENFHLYNGDFATELSQDHRENRCYSNQCRCPEYGNRDSKEGSCPRFGGHYCTESMCKNASNKKYRLVKLGVDHSSDPDHFKTLKWFGHFSVVGKP